MEDKKNIKTSIYYVIILVLVLLISAVTVSYAFINVVSESDNSANTTVSGKTECIDITLENADKDTTYSLTYNYPITDTFATTNSNVKPIKVTVTNNCTTAQNSNPIDYTVVLTTLADKASSDTYIPASKIKVKVVKQSSNGTPLIDTSLLNAVNTLTEGSTTKNILETKLSQEKTKEPSKFTESYYEHYVLDKSTIASNTSITYETYLWIDYNAGTDIEGKNFKTIISVVVNNPEAGLTAGLKTT